MSLVWFGDVSRRSGPTSTRTKHWMAIPAWQQPWLWWLALWLAALLLQSYTLLRRVHSWRQRVKSKRSLSVPNQIWSQRGLAIQIAQRRGMAPVVSVSYGNVASSFYTPQAAKDWLLELGMDPQEPALEWLWAMEEQFSE